MFSFKSNPSLQTRQLLTVVVGVLSLLVTHGILDVLHARSTLIDVEDRLETYAVEFGSNLDVDDAGNVTWTNKSPPDPRFDQDGSGLYAVVFRADKKVWSSASVGVRPVPPRPTSQGKTPWTFVSSSDDPQSLNTNRLRWPVLLDKEPGQVYTIMVYEDATLTSLKIQSFTYAIWGSLWASVVLILISQSLTTRWTIKPLRALMAEIDAVRSGRQPVIQQTYPTELNNMASSMNALIAHELHQGQSHRDALANLAHSLKTPLAVMRGTLDSTDVEMMKTEVAIQILKMDELVSYQLSVAARTGPSTFAQPELLEPIALEIVSSLEKLHKDRGIFCEFDIADGSIFRGDRGDLQELLGNVLENAFKWTSTRVSLTIKTDITQDILRIIVEDDGPGIPENRQADITQRGSRADEHVPGHGIGLAIVSDIIRLYKGSLRIDRSFHMGGALFEITLPLN